MDDIDEYNDVCPVCHYYHDNISRCVTEYNEEVSSSLYNPETGMLATIEEGDESTEAVGVV
jgi:hypothetical protein